ncbi:formyl transferase [Deferribacteraceae bacterium V6Fe1]|nr:formyl transferase [Deferribacteraceae bacterium V6Fe1]
MEKNIFPSVITYKKDFLRTTLSRDFEKFESFFNITYLGSNNYSDNKEKLDRLHIEVALCVDWTKDFFQGQKTPFKVLFTHPSLLPFYRGYGAITEQFLQGVVVSGLSVIQNSERVDGGDIIYQKEINIDFNDYPLDFISNYIKEIVSFTEMLTENNIDFDAKKQNENLGFYLVRKRNKNAIIDFGRDAFSIYNHIRGYSNPFFGAHFYYKNQKIKVFKSEIRAWQGNYGKPGQILNKEDDYIEVACGTGSIRLYSILSETDESLNINNLFLVNDILNH